MFFATSKILAFFAAPSNILIALAIIGMSLLFTRWAKFGRGLAFIALVLIAVLGMVPVGNMLLGVLEGRFPQWDASRGAPTGFIVLGGAVDPELSKDRNTPAIGTSGSGSPASLISRDGILQQNSSTAAAAPRCSAGPRKRIM